MVGPGAFIPYAEDSGLIAPLGVWVMREAARQAAAWKREGLNIRVAVNVSARQLEDKGLVSEFMSALSDAGLDPCMLDIELTESCLIEDEHSAIELIKQFRKLGARVHLDDFGTGYSSLSQLARIPLDAIAGRQLRARGQREPVSQALARAIVAVARTLELKVIAEGVETSEETAFLDTLGVDAKQGYLYAAHAGGRVHRMAGAAASAAPDRLSACAGSPWRAARRRRAGAQCMVASMPASGPAALRRFCAMTSRSM